MLRSLAILIAAAIVLLSPFSEAEPVQTHDLAGEDEPRLQRATDAWLDGEALGPITDLAALAHEGNMAARLLVSKLEDHGYAELPDLSPEDRYRLYRPPSDRHVPVRWPETEEMRDLPFAADWNRVGREKEPEVWLLYARRLIAAGERERVLEGIWRLNQHPFLAEFFDEITTIDDYEKLSVWLVRWQAHVAAELFADSAPRYWFEGWTGPPWSAEQEAAVRQAFGEKRVAALQFLRLRNRRGSEELAGSYLVDRTHDRSAELWDWYRSFIEMEPPTPTEWQLAGALLVADARHGNYLTPLLDICATRCAQAAEACMYSGVMHAGGLGSLSQSRSPLEAVISQDRWRKSFRARRDLLRRARAIQDNQAALRAKGHAAFRPPPGGCFSTLLED